MGALIHPAKSFGDALVANCRRVSLRNEGVYLLRFVHRYQACVIVVSQTIHRGCLPADRGDSARQWGRR